MEGEVSRVKRARLLSQKQIREIVMDSDSDEKKYYASSNTISTGLAEITRKTDAACVQWGAWGEQWCSDVWSVTWNFVWPELFWGLPHKRQIIRHFSSVLHAKSWSLDHNISKKHVYLQVFFRNVFSTLRKKKLQHFKAFWAMSDSFPTNCFYFTNLSRLVLEIFTFFEKHAQNLNTPAE